MPVLRGAHMDRCIRLALGLCAPFLLASCLITPGKFTSTLDIRADRSFTFSYQGEVIATDTDEIDSLDKSMGGEDDGDSRKISLLTAAAAKPAPKKAPPKPSRPSPAKPGAPMANNDAKMRELAEILAKEQGYRSVRYIGNNVFMIDYRISGRLDHGFIYPFNLDASLIVPFIAIELRGADRVRVKAPGYANGSDNSSFGMPGLPGGTSGDADKAAARLDGRFTLTTDAEIISQNQEEGVTGGANGKSISWKVTPQTTSAPMAVLKLRPLP